MDWDKARPKPPLDDSSKAILRKITEQFLATGNGIPDHAKRVELGPQRHLLNVLVHRLFLRDIGNKFYPGFAALYYLPPSLRARCEKACTWVIRAFQALYKDHGSRTFSVVEISVQINRMATRPVGSEAARLGMLFIPDFPNYFGTNFEYSPDAPIKTAAAWDNILDFENLQQAWDEEVARRYPTVQNASPGPDEKRPGGLSELKEGKSSMEKLRRVFVIHGRDERLRSGTFTFLRALGLEPLEWTKTIQLTGKASPYIGEILKAAFDHAQAAVVLLTPDDEARLRPDLLQADDPSTEGELNGQPRPNVLFEAGMSFASHPDQTVLVQFGRVRPFSDVAGRHVVKMDNSVSKRQEFAVKLKTAGCSVDMEGTDWQNDGDLKPPTIGEPPSSNNADPPKSGKPETTGSKLNEFKRVIIAPVSRVTSEKEFSLERVDEIGAVIRLANGVQVRVPKADYLESWDDFLRKPKLILTRKYFQGYFPGHESAEEYFLPR
jgi:predicted nucleotide-binding protein